MMDRLTSMAVFVKAVDLGSFAAAADALELSGPMVGKHVRFLEGRLGVQLLTRTTRRQSLTDFGRAFYERCRLVLAEADAAEALAADQLAQPRGKLRVTMPVHFGRRCVAPILLELVRQYPSLELDLSFNDRFVDLAEGDYDLAIRTGALDDKAGIVARRVARQRMVVCAAPGYLKARGTPRCVEDLARHEAVVYRRSGRIRPWLFPSEEGTAEEVTPANRVRLDDLDAIADAAASGIGLAWLPSWLVRERIRAGTLVQLLPDRRAFLYDAYALWMQTPHLALRVRLAIDTLAAQLADLMN
ncbi:LysR family transcriptional regulator [Trinickia acidisoli]|uniref:LysR family transcriptional regulator n=1 Tax=Trinickia acidisoli TaxID=2767482 RepID=UPI001F5C258B|nr:LysR family transcriptional regulator [Trinickia acidisoli]